MECRLIDLFYLRTGGAKIRALSTLDSREMGVCPEGKIAERRKDETRRETKSREKRREEKSRGKGVGEREEIEEKATGEEK